MERVPEIDGLRALAALSVFIHHAIGYPGLVRIAVGAWIGVDLFFAISGYLITSILLGMRDSEHYFRNFYIRRTLRIFPPYYAFAAICLVFCLLDRRYHFSGPLWTAFAFFGTSLAVVWHGYAGDVSRLPGPARAMEVTWSLSIEELFYLLWAPAVRYLKKNQLIGLVLVVIFLAPLVRWYVHSVRSGAEYYFFPARMDVLAFGALLALVRGRFQVWMPGWLVSVALVVSAFMLFVTPNPQSQTWFEVFGYSMIALSMTMLLAFVLDRAGQSDVLCRVLRSRLLVAIGTISYMFYLLHLFVIKSFREVFEHMLVSNWALNRVVQLTGSLAVTILLARISWKYFESPILKLKDRIASTRKSVSTARPVIVHGEGQPVSEKLA